ncbi:MAG: DUF935 family protein [Deltaproteobacteria bacterium]|nr:DUF935 family protein [Deltaproteobacteria bacterium]
MRLWLNENRFIELDERKPGETESLVSEIAVRSRTIDWMGFYAYLPDPDPVLEKLGQTLPVYRQLLSDAHVWSCYMSRKSGTLNQEWEIGEAKEGSKRANRAALEAIEGLLSRIDVGQIISEVLDAPFFGISALEVIWSHSDGLWLPERVEGKPPEWFVFSTENKLRFLSRDNMIQGEELPKRKFLLARHHASYQNPYGERVLARCFWPVAFKKGGFKFWAIFTEKYGMPWLIGKVPRATNETERSALLTRLVSMVQDAVAVINDDESVELKESAFKASSAGIYEKLVSAANREISKAVLGQTLSTELDKGGSYAATEGHLEVRQDIVDMDKRMVCQVMNTLFKYVVELNFAGAAAPAFTFYQEEDIQKDRAERDKTLTEQGLRFTRDYYRRVYNLQEGDFDLGEPSPEAPGGFAEAFKSGPGAKDDSPADILYALGEKTASSARFDALMAPIEDLLKRSATLEEFRDGLLDIYQDMDPEELGNLMSRAMTLAELAGRFDAMQGATSDE